MGLHSKKLRSLVGTLKDKASLSKATLLSTTTAAAATATMAPHLAVLRATTHQPHSEPSPQKHIDALLSFGRSSRPTAASAVGALVSRLGCTHDSAVALKCLIAVHHIVNHGGFILQDQLVSVFHPSSSSSSSGGRNHLNLSCFRDGSTPESWVLSSWVRWYARVLELILASYRVLGTFPNHHHQSRRRRRRQEEEEEEEEKAASLSNGDLLKEIDSLVGVAEEICKAPDTSIACHNRLVGEVVRLVGEDMAAAEYEILVRVREMGERFGCLGFGDSVELLCVLRRLERCREKISPEPSSGRDRFWSVVGEVKEKVGVATAGKEEDGRGLKVRRERESESARIGNRILLSSSEPVRFGSTRWSDR